ncbi:MAG: OmpA family protein [Kofleriaceae bacterium]
MPPDPRLRNPLLYSWLLLGATVAAGCGRGDSASGLGAAEQAVLGDNDDDGIPDNLDLDDDNDGIPDQVECPAPTLAAQDFWMMFNPNNSASGRRDVHVAGAPGTLVTIAGAAPVAIPASGFLTVDSGLTRVPALNVIESGKAFQVTSNAPIQVFGNNFQPFTVDAFTVVPVQLLGTEYYAVGYPNSIGLNSQVSVYATEDNTQVTIGTAAPITLNRGQSFLRAQVGDATGVHIVANKPVAVNSGDNCLNTGAGACDHVEEMLFPVDSWASDYYIPVIPQGQNYRVVAATAGTTVTVDGAVVATLNPGQFYAGTGGRHRVQTSHPTEVYIIALGDTSGTGDPAFILVPGAQNGVTTATFGALAADNVNTLVVSMPTASTGSLRLDGSPVAGTWVAYPSGGFSYISLTIAVGSHTLTATDVFIPIIWGEKSYESYGYVGGYGYPPGTCSTDTDGDGIVDSFDLDSDGDGVSDVDEAGGTDTNHDGIADGPIDANGIPTSSGGGLTPPDTDGDGVDDNLDPDSDNDGVPDLTDANRLVATICRDVDGDGCDDCSVTGANHSGGNVANDGPDADADGVCNGSDPDDDNDGVLDAADSAPTNPNQCRDLDADSCDDCALTGANGSGGNVANDGLDTDGDGACNAGDADDDNDGVADASDVNPTNPNLCRDLDADTCDDCSLTGADGSGGSISNDGPDDDGDGLCNAGDNDNDNDGVRDPDDANPTNPHVCRDLDGDGCDDCTLTGADFSGGSTANDGPDFDGDGQCNSGDPDDDNDGVADASDSNPTNPTVCRDADADTCDDCSLTGADGSGGSTANDGADLDADGLCDLGDSDDDNDGVADGDDSAPTNPAACRDVDGDSCDDCAVTGADGSGGAPANDGPDVDLDGTCDAGEDLDGDGVIDTVDLDSDNDGIPNVDEAPALPGVDPYGDDDGDGIANYLDADDRGDGAPAGCPDGDGDGRCDTLASGWDSDGDGVPNHLDLDSDNDSIPDVIEAGHAGTDADHDGMVDGPYGANGLADQVETSVDSGEPAYVIRDTDGDGTPDFTDLDADGDGATDIAEAGNGTLDGNGDGRVDAAADADHDGLADVVDAEPATVGYPSVDLTGTDADGDGIPDAYDAAGAGPGPGDSNGDGLRDDVQCPNPPGWPHCPDSDGDGTPDYSELADADGDGVADLDDLDADNDGILDTAENLLGLDPLADADGDGVPNYLDATDRGDGQAQACPDADGDGRCEAPGPAYDTDGDGVPNHRDLDSDNDGIPDVVEAGHGGTDANHDGQVDGPYGANGLADQVETAPDSGLPVRAVLDTDGDGTPDFLDLDSDGDGAFDLAEVAALAGLDGDGDGRIDATTDADHDGLMGPVDADDASYGFPTAGTDPTADDADGDDIPDAYDADDAGPGSGDSDGDGILDVLECPGTWPCPDSDGDGTPDYMEENDADGDGVGDAADGDADGDGLRNLDETGGLDPYADHDADGIPNYLDADDQGDGQPAGCVDADADDICDAPGPRYDTDGDGIPDFLDLDSDGDHIYDADEAGHGGLDADGDGRVDGPVGTNGIADALETSADSGQPNYTPADTDGDGTPDFQDTDSDGDHIADADEAGDADLVTEPVDTDGDGTPDYRDVDSDGDGITDADEAGDADPATGPVDTDADGTPDFQDTDADGDGLPDADEAGDADPATPPVDTDGDGTPDFQDDDADNDGIADRTDNCHLVANGDQANDDGDLLGNACDPDDNNDGFLDGVGVAGGGCSTSGNGGGLGTLTLLAAAAMFTRRRRRRAAAMAVAATAATAGVAAAQSVTEARDFSVERFALASDREGVLGVEGASVAPTGTWDVHLWLGTANDPLVVYMDDGAATRLGSLVGQRTGGELGVSYAVHPRINLALDVPLVLAQDRDPSIAGVSGMLGGLGGVGLGDLRLRPKLALLRQGSAPVDLALIAELELPTARATDYRGDDGLAFTPTLAVGRRDGALRWSGNLAYAARPATQVAGLTVDDELRLSVGAAYRVAAPVELGATIAGATAAGDPLGGAGRTSLELVAGPTVELAGNWVVFAAGGAGLDNGYGTPDWRALAGVRLGRLGARGPGEVGADGDGDGVLGAADRCPTEAEDLDGFQDGDGCPDLDNDGDGVADADDGAPLEAEDHDGFQDGDGVPDLDNDGDGVADAADRCPDQAENVNGFEDADGCPDEDDADGDGLRGAADQCPTQAEDADGFQDADGCPDDDNDGDGVADGRDRCPGEAGPAENYGCADSDDDGDGVPYRIDVCPTEAGKTVFDGCKTKQKVSLRDGKVVIVEPVFFATGKAKIERRSFALLDNVAQVLRDHVEMTIQVEGHTDDQADDAYNKDLSQRRADAVRAYLVDHGIAADRLTAVGFGEERPVADNATRKGRALNRRVAFVVVGVFGFDVRGGEATPTP